MEGEEEEFNPIVFKNEPSRRRRNTDESSSISGENGNNNNNNNIILLLPHDKKKQTQHDIIEMLQRENDQLKLLNKTYKDEAGRIAMELQECKEELKQEKADKARMSEEFQNKIANQEMILKEKFLEVSDLHKEKQSLKSELESTRTSLAHLSYRTEEQLRTIQLLEADLCGGGSAMFGNGSVTWKSRSPRPLSQSGGDHKSSLDFSSSPSFVLDVTATTSSSSVMSRRERELQLRVSMLEEELKVITQELDIDPSDRRVVQEDIVLRNQIIMATDALHLAWETKCRIVAKLNGKLAASSAREKQLMKSLQDIETLSRKCILSQAAAYGKCFLIQNAYEHLLKTKDKQIVSLKTKVKKHYKSKSSSSKYLY